MRALKYSSTQPKRDLSQNTIYSEGSFSCSWIVLTNHLKSAYFSYSWEGTWKITITQISCMGTSCTLQPLEGTTSLPKQREHKLGAPGACRQQGCKQSLLAGAVPYLALLAARSCSWKLPGRTADCNRADEWKKMQLPKGILVCNSKTSNLMGSLCLRCSSIKEQSSA